MMAPHRASLASRSGTYMVRQLFRRSRAATASSLNVTSDCARFRSYCTINFRRHFVRKIGRFALLQNSTIERRKFAIPRREVINTLKTRATVHSNDIFAISLKRLGPLFDANAANTAKSRVRARLLARKE